MLSERNFIDSESIGEKVVKRDDNGPSIRIGTVVSSTDCPIGYSYTLAWGMGQDMAFDGKPRAKLFH